MVILLEIALALALVSVVIGFVMRGRKAADRQEAIERRVEAYMQTIRREGSNAELAAMSDAELRDVLLSGAQNLRVQSDRRWYLLLGGGVLAFLSAIAVATEQGLQGFGIVLLIGAVVLYGLNEFIGRRMREPLQARGIDVERLRVE